MLMSYEHKNIANKCKIATDNNDRPYIVRHFADYESDFSPNNYGNEGDPTFKIRPFDMVHNDEEEWNASGVLREANNTSLPNTPKLHRLITNPSTLQDTATTTATMGYTERPIKLPLRKYHSFHFQPTQTVSGQKSCKLQQLKQQQLQMQKFLKKQHGLEEDFDTTPSQPYDQQGPLIFLPYQINEDATFKPIQPSEESEDSIDYVRQYVGTVEKFLKDEEKFMDSGDFTNLTQRLKEQQDFLKSTNSPKASEDSGGKETSGFYKESAEFGAQTDSGNNSLYEDLCKSQKDVTEAEFVKLQNPSKHSCNSGEGKINKFQHNMHSARALSVLKTVLETDTHTSDDEQSKEVQIFSDSNDTSNTSRVCTLSRTGIDPDNLFSTPKTFRRQLDFLHNTTTTNSANDFKRNSKTGPNPTNEVKSPNSPSISTTLNRFGQDIQNHSFKSDLNGNPLNQLSIENAFKSPNPPNVSTSNKTQTDFYTTAQSRYSQGVLSSPRCSNLIRSPQNSPHSESNEDLNKLKTTPKLEYSFRPSNFSEQSDLPNAIVETKHALNYDDINANFKSPSSRKLSPSCPSRKSLAFYFNNAVADSGKCKSSEISENEKVSMPCSSSNSKSQGLEKNRKPYDHDSSSTYFRISKEDASEWTSGSTLNNFKENSQKSFPSEKNKPVESEKHRQVSTALNPAAPLEALEMLTKSNPELWSSNQAGSRQNLHQLELFHTLQQQTKTEDNLKSSNNEDDEEDLGYSYCEDENDEEDNGEDVNTPHSPNVTVIMAPNNQTASQVKYVLTQSHREIHI